MERGPDDDQPSAWISTRDGRAPASRSALLLGGHCRWQLASGDDRDHDERDADGYDALYAGEDPAIASSGIEMAIDPRTISFW